jgi:hypothetical protein
MALYKRSSEISTSTSTEFDTEHDPGSRVPHSAIYRCLGCGREVVCNAGDPFPPQNHHQHTTAQGRIRWRMSVFAQGDPH